MSTDIISIATQPSARRKSRLPFSGIAFACLTGAIGGAAFQAIGTPLPWLLGSLFMTMLAALLRVPVSMPQGLRMVFTAALGLLVGSRITETYFQDVFRWVESAAGLVVFMIVSSAVVYAYLRRFCGLSPVTAYFGAVPGGINEMTLIGSQLGADERTLALLHGCRLFLTVSLMPVFLYVFVGVDVGTAAGIGSDAPLSPFDIVLMVTCAVTGTTVATWLHMPGAALIGPMIVFGTASGLGLGTAAPPDWLISIAQIVVGAALGARFRGLDRRFLVRTMRFALGATVIQLNFALVFAFLVNLATGLGVGRMILAYSPGGQVEMSLLALSMGSDAAFITVHAMFRAILVVLLSPVIYRVLALAWPPLAPARGMARR